MKRYMYFIICAISAIVATPYVSAQQIMEGQAEVKNFEIDRNGGLITVNMDIDVTALKVGADEIVILTPVIVKGAQEQVLPAIEVMGRRSNIYYKRNDEHTITSSPFYVERVAKRAESKKGLQIIDYTATTSLQEWMRNAQVVIRQESCGCDNQPLALGDNVVKDRLLPAPYVPQYVLAFVEPQPEPVKVREESFSAYINFIADKYEILENYKNNASELAGVIASIQKVEADDDLTISAINIEGWASPEATEVYNKTLSQNRANSLIDYIVKKTSITREMMSAQGMGEDWAGLKREVEATPMLLDQKKVLAIIDRQDMTLDEKDKALEELVPPTIYQRLMNEMYPRLRRNDYRIVYNVRNFNMEEARNLIKSAPNKLSLAEMYKVAGSYTKGSKEYNEVLAIAYQTYPTTASAAVNYAALQIADGKYDAALAILAKCTQSDGVVLNAQGYAYVAKGEIQKALEVWKRAETMGNSDAKHNAAELNKYLKSIE